MKNEARGLPLSGKFTLQRYGSRSDLDQLVNPTTFRKTYFEKWGRAPWMSDPSRNGFDVLVLDTIPPTSCPSSSTSIGQTTFESER
jgi:hypothetical protein